MREQRFNEVLAKHGNMIHYLIHKLGVCDPENEFYQEGIIALWDACKTYNKSRGKFSSYAYFRIEKALLSLIRKRTKQTEREYDYVEQHIAEQNQLTASPETSFDPYLLKRIRTTLTTDQMKWFTFFILEDMPIKTIAEQEQVSINTVKSWARHAKPKLQRLLCNEYGYIKKG